MEGKIAQGRKNIRTQELKNVIAEAAGAAVGVDFSIPKSIDLISNCEC